MKVPVIKGRLIRKLDCLMIYLVTVQVTIIWAKMIVLNVIISSQMVICLILSIICLTFVIITNLRGKLSALFLIIVIIWVITIWVYNLWIFNNTPFTTIWHTRKCLIIFHFFFVFSHCAGDVRACRTTITTRGGRSTAIVVVFKGYWLKYGSLSQLCQSDLKFGRIFTFQTNKTPDATTTTSNHFCYIPGQIKGKYSNIYPSLCESYFLGIAALNFAKRTQASNSLQIVVMDNILMLTFHFLSSLYYPNQKKLLFHLWYLQRIC